MINKILYINLEHRTDRKESVEEELKKLNYPPEMIQRVDAIKKDNGALGCTLSHLKCLEIAMENDYECVMIVEDDLGFKENINEKKFRDLLDELNKFSNFDICSLTCSGYGKNIQKETQEIAKAITIQTTTGYIIRKKFYKTLYDNFNKSKEKFENGKHRCEAAIDIMWKQLQGKNSNFYVFEPIIAFQKPSYSDIEKMFANYIF